MNYTLRHSHTTSRAHRRLWAFLTLTSTCSLQVSWKSRITARFMTDIERLKVIQKKCGSKKWGCFLFLVNIMSSVLSGFTNSPTSLNHASAIYRASLHEPWHRVWEFSHRKKTSVICITLNVYPTSTEPCFQSTTNKAPQKMRRHTPLWATPGNSNARGKTNESLLNFSVH